MKAQRGSITRSVEQPDRSIRFYLLYGPDDSGSRGLANKLLKALDAEKLALTGAAVKADPALLAAEAGAISLFGGARLIWVDPAGDDIVEAVEGLLEAPAVESLVVAIGGALRKTSALVRLAESHGAALSYASYALEGRDADRMVIELGRGEGLQMDPSVASAVAAACDANQSIVAHELAKFALYLGASADRPKELTREVVDLLGAESGEGDMMRLGDLALAGQANKLFEELDRVALSNSEAIPVIRALQRRLIQLTGLRAQIDQGKGVDAVMTSMGKALFWKDKALMQRLLSGWTSERLAAMLERSSALEKAIFFSDEPPVAALEEELVTIARAAQRRG
ncbi:DNA polymerase III subunit delta [Sphingomonas alba]|uniref:DNA-directed DNA polymerase n=1 Tax=Sphingomonas alba TaxID=2908208 RepID=A0ABT0RME5_9SPHN|nr:DNA polymerase III subunit delta [Sphingomonas alba]MCL6683822.1 DNA polymerase III subunit delta [Sphingomonas alba]